MMTMTIRETFDKVKDHLLTQMEKALADLPVGAKIRCAYRGVEGRKCAVGCLIDDQYFDIGFNLEPVTDLGVKEALRKSGVDLDVDGMGSMLCKLQQIHDGTPADAWRNLLAFVEEELFNYGRL